jgi:hypothetical protein
MAVADESNAALTQRLDRTYVKLSAGIRQRIDRGTENLALAAPDDVPGISGPTGITDARGRSKRVTTMPGSVAARRGDRARRGQPDPRYRG